MIYEVDSNLRKDLYSVFKNIDCTLILSCLQGHMGKAWADDIEKPTVVQVIVGVFAFYAGNHNSKEAEELLYNLPENILVIVDTEEWKKRIEIIHKGRMEKFQRYRFKRAIKNLDVDHLNTFLSTLPEGYELKKIDKSLAKNPSLQELSEDFTSQFKSIDDYINIGIGFCILHNEKIVSAASSYSVYDEGIEIEVDTLPEYRRKGLATIAAAALILDCISKGKYPSWDAANLESVKLAQKLGYVLKEPYDTYYVNYIR